jgi:hypothetical protein
MMSGAGLVRRTVTAAAILLFCSGFTLNGTCLMDVAAGPAQHGCCTGTRIAAAPPECCAGAPVIVAAMAPRQAPRALPAAPHTDLCAASAARTPMCSHRAEIADAIAPSPPALLRV